MNGPKVSGNAALVKFGYMLENPCIPGYSSDDPSSFDDGEAGSNNPSDAGNQQERLINRHALNDQNPQRLHAKH
jgi:hypothetical protein